MIDDIISNCLTVFIEAFWIMIPAYIANVSPPVVGGGTPIDFGRNANDGRRYFGDGKTWRGLIGGSIIGIIFGCIQIILYNMMHWDSLPQHTYVTVIALSMGALLGDLTKSYFKRRLGKDRGTKWPIADVYDLVLGSLILLCILAPIWAIQYLSIWVLIAIFILTPLLHRSFNIIGYYIGVKDVPW